MYPEDVVAVTSRGEREVRVLEEKGKYVKYGYVEEKSGKEVKNKFTIALQGKKEVEKFMVVEIGGKGACGEPRESEKDAGHLGQEEKEAALDFPSLKEGVFLIYPF